MLVTLQIENYALIEQVSMAFGPGLNVLTGETGSGKSILVDALGLLLGERAEAAVIRSGSSQAVVTGTFSSPFASAAEAAAWSDERGLAAPESEIRLRREVGGSRSRAFIGHEVVTVGLMRQLAQRLGEIHSQNEALVSFTPAAQLRLLDRFAGIDEGVAALGAAFAEWRQWRDRLRSEQEEQQQRLRRQEQWRFESEELAAAQLRPDEDRELEQERQLLVNAGRILADAQAAYQCLYESDDAAAAQLKAALRPLQDWQRFDASLTSLCERLESARAEVNDVAAEVRRLADQVEAAPERLAEIELRLVLLDRLKRKYGPTLAEVMAHHEAVEQQLQSLQSAAAAAAAAGAQEAAAAAAYRSAAASLSKKRRAAAPRLARALEAEVQELAMQLRFEVEFANPPAEAPPDSWTPTGWDQVRFHASLNPGEALQPVAESASGGELSRLLLALHLTVEANAKRAAKSATRRTLVLDEIDAGIGGKAAAAVGRKLQRLGEHYQVLCVTHLAQIASYAAHHLSVEKAEHRGRTRTQVQELRGKERIAEIARMLAGDADAPTALRHARELLQASGAAGS
jgi:DNA repair protein RecN (Recombination protein N)